MSLFHFRKASKNKIVTSSNNINIVFDEESLNHMLDMIFRFFDAYSKKCPNEWYLLYISQIFEHINNTTYGYLEFKIILGSWWDGLLSSYPEISDYMTLFAFDSDEKTFTYTNFLTSVSNGNSPQEKVNTILQKYLDNYEAKHREIKFERYNWGAGITKNL